MTHAHFSGNRPTQLDMLMAVAPFTPQDHQNEKDHRSDRWSQKPQRLFVGNCLATPVNCTQTGSLLCRVDARFALDNVAASSQQMQAKPTAAQEAQGAKTSAGANDC